MKRSGIKRTERPCSVDGCSNRAWSRGWCNTHYSRWRKYGDPVAPDTRRRVDHAEVVARYERGESLVQISEEMSIDSGHASRILSSRGIAARSAESYATPFSDAEVLARFDAGEGHVPIARDLGVSIDRVKRSLLRSGRRPRGAGRVKGLGLTGGPVKFETEFQAIRPKIIERAGGRCEAGIASACPGVGRHVHHRKMRSQGGSNAEENLINVCVFCHTKIHTNPADSYAAGLLLHSWEPETTEVRR